MSQMEREKERERERERDLLELCRLVVVGNV
jgi:hypothetical protein